MNVMFVSLVKKFVIVKNVWQFVILKSDVNIVVLPNIAPLIFCTEKNNCFVYTVHVYVFTCINVCIYQ